MPTPPFDPRQPLRHRLAAAREQAAADARAERATAEDKTDLATAEAKRTQAA